MRHSKFTESQIVFAIKQVETGIRLSKVFYKIGISEATFYNCKKKYESLGYQNRNCSPHILALIQKDNNAPYSSIRKLGEVGAGYSLSINANTFGASSRGINKPNRI